MRNAVATHFACSSRLTKKSNARFARSEETVNSDSHSRGPRRRNRWRWRYARWTSRENVSTSLMSRAPGKYGVLRQLRGAAREGVVAVVVQARRAA